MGVITMAGSLYVYTLRQEEIEQTAWVSAASVQEASNALFRKREMPVVVHNDHGWVLLPDRRRSGLDEP